MTIGKTFLISAGVAGLLIAAGVVSWSITSGNGAQLLANANAPPIIRPPPGPERRQPEDEGGKQIPFRDLEVFERLGQGAKQAPLPTGTVAASADASRDEEIRSIADLPQMVGTEGAAEAPLDAEEPSSGAEELLPPPAKETPVAEDNDNSPPAGQSAKPTADVATGPDNSTAGTTDTEQRPTSIADLIDGIPVPAARPDVASRPPETSPEPASETPANEETVAARAPEPAPVPDGSYRIQVAAVRDPGAAEGEWRRLMRNYGDILGGLTPQVVTADLGSRGIFHRLRAGPLPNRAAAESVCAALAKRDVGCLVVAP